MTRTFIFDLDGVLIDSMPFHYDSWRRSFAAFGLDVVDREIYERESEEQTVTAAELYEQKTGRPASSSVVGRLVRAKDAIYRNRFELILCPGALELLAFLRSAGARLGLVSGSHSVRDSLAGQAGLAEMFDAMITGLDGLPAKPNPAPYRLAMVRLGVSASSCTVVENSPLGIRSAVASGATCFAVRGSSILSAERLCAAGAHLVFEDLAALQTHLVSDQHWRHEEASPGSAWRAVFGR